MQTTIEDNKRSRWLVILFIMMAILLSWELLSIHYTYYQGPKSNHFDGKHFFNPGRPHEKPYWRMLYHMISHTLPYWPESVKIREFDVPPQVVEGNQIRFSFVGHMTVLIQTQGINILTDPIWSKRASPLSWIGPKRVASPGIVFKHLPKIDYVLISHSHYDHMDMRTIKRLWQRDRPHFIVPLGNDTILRRNEQFINVTALDWGEQYKMNDKLSVHLEQSQHWSSRLGPLDYNKALWGAFVISTPTGNIYFAGDTGYGDGAHFKKAQIKYGRFILSLLPIGSYLPGWFMGYSHMDPQDAVKAMLDLHSRLSLGLHYRTFQLTYTPYGEAQKNLRKALNNYSTNPPDFLLLAPGEHRSI